MRDFREIFRGARLVPIALLVAGMLALCGCGRGLPQASFADVATLTEETLRDVLLGPGPNDAVLSAPLDPPLLKQGVYETVWITADADAFARVSNGSVSAEDVRSLQKRVTEKMAARLEKRGFSARSVPFDAVPPGEEKTLLATLTPTTQEGGSPKEQAENKNKTFLLVRLTITNAATGAILTRRDYYSGRDVKSPGP